MSDTEKAIYKQVANPSCKTTTSPLSMTPEHMITHGRFFDEPKPVHGGGPVLGLHEGQGHLGELQPALCEGEPEPKADSAGANESAEHEEKELFTTPDAIKRKGCLGFLSPPGAPDRPGKKARKTCDSLSDVVGHTALATKKDD